MAEEQGTFPAKRRGGRRLCSCMVGWKFLLRGYGWGPQQGGVLSSYWRLKSTMCVKSSWQVFSNLYLCAHSTWWLMHSQRACRRRRSSGVARSWLVMFLSPLAYYVAWKANICDYCVFHDIFHTCLIMFFLYHVHTCIISVCLPIICFSIIPLLCMGDIDTAPSNKICRRAPLAWAMRTLSWAPTNEILSRMRKFTFEL